MLARHEPDRETQPFSEVDLQKLAQQTVADHHMLAESKNIDLGVETSAIPIHAQGNVDGLRVLLSNLIDNALRYTPSGGRVDVAAILNNGHPTLRVSDNGPGIPPEDRSRVFDRFYRPEGNEAWGSGLGLSIVKNIADLHGAQIHLSDGAGQGLTVTLVFRKQGAAF
jgi:two-component system OmpR family sensor kinase